MMLVVDCCIRGDCSATRRYYKAYLQKRSVKDVQYIELSKLVMAPLDSEALQKREALCAERNFDHAMFHLAHQFRSADEILIAAPFWDLSFPALLKIYFEHVTVSGLTFGYDEQGCCLGYCKANRILYFSTCDGYVGKKHLGFEYVKALGAMLGINECVPYIIEGMDVDPSRREAILNEAIAGLPNSPENIKCDLLK